MATGFRSFLVIALCLSIGLLASGHDGQDEPALTARLSFKKDTLNIQAAIATQPVVGEESFILLEAKNPANHENIEIADTVEVSLWMPDMGHGSAPTTVERALNEKGEIIPGVYHVRDVYFTMGGEWEVNVTLTDVEGNSESQIFTVKLKGGHHH